MNQYKPELLSELEVEYPEIEKYLAQKQSFIVNGSNYCGKTTIVELYLKVHNYDYLILNDPTINKETIQEKIKYSKKSVMSIFYNKNFVIVVDNFDQFNSSIKNIIIQLAAKHQIVIITNKYLCSKINYVKIYDYSTDYLMNLYSTIYFLETGVNCDYIPPFKNILQLYSYAEYFTKQNNLGSSRSSGSRTGSFGSLRSPDIIYDDFSVDYSELTMSDFGTKLRFLDKIKSYSLIQYNILYNFPNNASLDDINKSYDLICDSFYFQESNLEYYSILSIIGSTHMLSNFRIKHENIQIKKKSNSNNGRIW